MKITQFMVIALFFVNHLLTIEAQALYNLADQIYTSSSACSEYFSYENGYYGVSGKLSIPAWNPSKSVIKAVLSVATRISNGDYGDISLLKSKADTANDISNGYPLTLRVRFPVTNPLPKITKLYYNDRLICSGPKEVAAYVTTLTLTFTFTIEVSYQNRIPQPVTDYSQYNRRTTNRPLRTYYFKTYPSTTRYRTTPRTTRTYPQTTKAPPNYYHQSIINDLAEMCGVPSTRPSRISGLIFGGTKAVRGQFPWLTAYFYNDKFNCAGSLVSSKIVVTAAHCIQTKNSDVIKTPDDSTFYLGKTNINTLTGEPNYVQSIADQLIMHPSWNINDQLYDSDVAIAILKKTIAFNRLIQPICIWRRSSNYKDVANENGEVAGWGKTEDFAEPASEALYAPIKIIDNEECIHADRKLYTFASRTTFCASGFHKLQGPCNGDSGGALVVTSGGKSYLRGIVSAGIVNSNTGNCDNEYTLYTDAARFTPWIDELIETYG